MSDDGLFEPDDFRYSTRSTATRMLSGLETFNRFREVEQITEILDNWTDLNGSPEYDPIPTLTSLAEIIEQATDEFLKQDPDPQDDRHPHRTHPHSAFGNILKALFKNDHFMNKLTISYLLTRDNTNLNVAAARLLLDCVPGLDAEVIFSEPEDFISTLYTWAKGHENEMLQAYAMGLLSAALEIADNASKYRSMNFQLIPIALRRLGELKDKMLAAREAEPGCSNSHQSVKEAAGPFSDVLLHEDASRSNSNDDVVQNGGTAGRSTLQTATRSHQEFGGSNQSIRVRPAVPIVSEPCNSPPRKRRKSVKDKASVLSSAASFGSLQDLESSNSCWNKVQPYIIGTHKIYPLSVEMHQRLILQFLGPTGEYQDLLSLAYEGKAMDLIFFYINLEQTRDVRLTFDALRYLTSLLVHRKFALEFIAHGGVQALLKVPRGCMASVAAVTCLYYLAYNEDVMEKVCLLDEKILDDLCDYCLWCLEHSYESGMHSASLFFTHTCYFKAMLSRFDQRDGLRKLYNYVSTLSILNDSLSAENLSEEQMHTSTQSARSACAAFRSYLTAHLYIKLETLKKTCKGLTQYLSLPSEAVPHHKMIVMNEESLELSVEVLTSILKVSNSGWRQMEEARRLGVVTTMFTILENIGEWHTITGVSKSEMIKCSLDVLWLCSTLPKVQTDFCEIIPSTKKNGFRILLNVADGSLFSDESGQLSALRTIINCLANAIDKNERKGSFRLESRKQKQSHHELNAHEKKIWASLRDHDIIMLLDSVIRETNPPLEADRLRDFGCRAMLALARCEEVRQIVSNLPLIANNELQGLMKQPVAQEQKADHVKFCKSAKSLIETVTQKPINDRIPDPRDLTQERLWKSHVVENTRISYNEKELLQLIHGHLVRKGLKDTADQLVKEAQLPDVPASRVSTTPAKLQPLPKVLELKTPSQSRRSLLIGTPSSSTTPSLYNNVSSSPMNGSSSGFKKPMKTPINKRLLLRTPARPSTFQRDKILQPFKGLDDIVTDYFKAQHSMCSNPVTTCPPFSLFYPHHCPEPRSFNTVAGNIVKRFNDRSIRRPFELQRSLLQDEKYAFSRFKTSRTLSDQDEMYTACAFSIDDEHLIVGMFSGDIFWINVETGVEEAHTLSHSSGVTAINPSKDGSMLLTSSVYVRPLSCLWRLAETQEHLYDLRDEQYVQFSNITQDKIIGTGDGKATVFDTETGHAVMVFGHSTNENKENRASRYRYNVAAFSPCDTMVMNEGMLWDVRDPSKMIHSFDKLNSTNGGVFHPHGREIIINNEVWDMRTFHLLRTVPALDQSRIKFNSTGNILYAATHNDAHHSLSNHFGSSFRTFDSSDYSIITTVDTKRDLLDFSCSHGDQFMAVIELRQTCEFPGQEQSAVRMYDVGKRREAEDDLDEGEEENDDGDDGRDDDSDDSMSDDSLSGESIGIFGALQGLENLERGSSESSDSDSSLTDVDDDEEDDFSAGDNDSDSSGWETASNENYVENGDDDNNHPDMDNHADHAEEGDDNPEEDDMDESYNPPDEDQHPSTSSIALNPHVRRQKRRHSESGNR